MATKKYYVNIDTLWANSPEWFVGPFNTRADAEAEIERAINAPDSKVQLHTKAALDVRDGIRVWGIMPKSAARRAGMRESGWRKANLISKTIPLSRSALRAVVEELDRLE